MTFQKAGSLKNHQLIKLNLQNCLNYLDGHESDKYYYRDYRNSIKLFLDNYDKVALHIIGFIFDFVHEHSYSPYEIKHRVSHMNMFCIKDGKFLDLFEQNEQSKKYPHYDFSIKRLSKLLNVKGESWPDICN
jgi:hypothetical protein